MVCSCFEWQNDSTLATTPGIYAEGYQTRYFFGCIWTTWILLEYTDYTYDNGNVVIIYSSDTIMCT